MKNLFRARLIVNNFPHGVHIYDNLSLCLNRSNWGDWYQEDEYREVIKDYDSLQKGEKVYYKLLIDKLFTLEEIEQMQPWFKKFSQSGFIVEEIKLPISCDISHVCEIPIGGSRDCYLFYLHEDYPLMFNVEGLYDVFGHKPISFEEFKRRRKKIDEIEKKADISKIFQCQINNCKNKATKKFKFNVTRYELGFKGDKGCSLSLCTVYTCDRHSFKASRKIFYEYLDNNSLQLMIKKSTRQ